MNPILTLYAVRSRDGKWFRATGYGGAGKHWVDELARAKIYPKLSQARSRVTYYAKNFPDFGVPEVVALNVDEIKPLDESERVAKTLRKHKRREEEQEVRRYKSDVQRATAQLADAQAKLERLRSKGSA